jgi:hypothetical protein
VASSPSRILLGTFPITFASVLGIYTGLWSAISHAYVGLTRAIIFAAWITCMNHDGILSFAMSVSSFSNHSIA